MKKLTFFVIFIILEATTISLAEFLNIKIIPLKKPLLEQAEIEKRLAKEEIRPIPKPGTCLLYTSPSPRDAHESRMPSSA